jgi:HD-GYP domain-containing protein (c-di-GMP phosphodiesterase class II)
MTMVAESDSFFTIELEQLNPQENQTFPFHLYVYNPANEKYSTYLFANSPMTLEKKEFLEMIVSKGGRVAISKNQTKTFLSDRNLKEEDIEDLIEIPEHEFITRRRERLEKREKKLERGQFHFRDELEKAAKNDDWMPLIREAREEAMTFSFTVSHTVSLASSLAEKLLTSDSYTNRIVALSVHLAKSCGMNDALALGDLICAAFLSHIGHTQMSLIYSQKPQIEMNDKERREYKKHPGLSQHLIRKSGLIISERCNRILYQHHERFDGGGYPEYKQGQFIEPLALILGASAHILEYTSGKITGSPVPMKVVVTNMKNKTLSPGLEIEFGDTIYESLIYLLDTNENSENKDNKVAA